jgi:hypothetical protein
VVAGGQLAASGRLTDILAFEIRGWEVVLAEMTPELLGRISDLARRTTEIGHGRYAIELSTEQSPERLAAELTSRGAKLLSINPIRDTLEDFFVRRVEQVGAGARDREVARARD